MPHVSQGKNNMKLLSCRHVADIDAAYLVSHIQWLQCLSRQSAYLIFTYAVQTAQHAAIVHHVEGTYHLAGCSCPNWTREARSCSAPGSRLPSTFHCQRESGLYNDGAPTYTYTAVYRMYLPTVQLLRPSSPTHPSRRHRDIPIGLTTSTGGSPSAANIRTNPHLPPKCLLTSGGHSVHTDSAQFLSTGSSPRNASTRGHC